MGHDGVQNQRMTSLAKSSSKLPDQTTPEENGMNIEDRLIQL
jgi:hypothetical protein